MTTVHRCLWPAALAGLLFAAQEADRPPSPVIRVTSELVQFDVTVTDSRNRPVTDLQASDLSVTEDGKPQTITSFSYSDAASGPRSIVFLVDTCEVSSISGQVNQLHLSFLSDFIDHQVYPGDSVAIMGTAEGEGYNYGPFSDREHLHRARRAVRMAARNDPACMQYDFEALKYGGYGGGPEGMASQPRNYGIASYDAIAAAIDGLASAPGRRSLVVFSVFHGWSARRAGGREMDDLVNRAKSAGVAVYVIDHDRGIPPPDVRYLTQSAGRSGVTPLPPQDPPMTKAHNARLLGPARLADETGGFVIDAPFYPEPREDVKGLPLEQSDQRLVSQRARSVNGYAAEFAKSVERVAADIAGAYQIGFRPLADFKGAPKFHKVKITVKRKGLKAHARNGYYAPPLASPSEPQTPDESLDTALRTPFRGKSIATRLLTVQSAAKDAKSGRWRGAMRAIVSVDPSGLAYQDAPGGAKRAEVELHVAAFGDGNREAANASRKCASTLKPAEFAARASLRLLCNLDVPIAEPGGYVLRAAVLDGQSGKTGSAYAFASLPNYAVAGTSYRSPSGNTARQRIMLSGMLLGLAETGASAEDGMHPAGANPVERDFPAGATLAYSFEAYGTAVDRKTGLPSLTGTALVLSPLSVVPVTDSGPMPIRAEDPNKIAVRGRMALKAGLEPGTYSLMFQLTDELNLPRFSTRIDPSYGSGTTLDFLQLDFAVVPARR
jgi:VWFA-related protein